MGEHKQASLVFGIGFFSLILLVIIGLFFSELLSPTLSTDSAASVTEQTELTPLPSTDPLVSVVPGAGVQGTPRMIASDPRRGASKPTVTIMEFGDFQCGDCAAMSAVVAEVVAAYPQDVRHVWKDFPITSEHEQAEQASVAARCAQKQDRFWEYHDYLLENQTSFPLLPWGDFAEGLGLNLEQFNACLHGEDERYLVTQSFTVARTLGLKTAPTYYINDRLVEGPMSASELTNIVEEEIQKSGNTASDE